MNTLESVQQNYAHINAAAGAFLLVLPSTGIEKDISIAAEMAGLMMLRAASEKLPDAPAGTVVLGLLPDEVYDTMHRFIFSWAKSNGLNPKFDFPSLPKEAKIYHPEVTKFEMKFYDICQKNKIEAGLFPFVAASAAMKLVSAGEQLKLLDAKIGQAMVIYHIISGSKTIPFPSE